MLLRYVQLTIAGGVTESPLLVLKKQTAMTPLWEAATWLNKVLCSGSHEIAIKMSATLHPHVEAHLRKLQFQAHSACRQGPFPCRHMT